MLPSTSNNVSCQVNQITMDINDILQRITPIEFIPNPLTEQLLTASLGTLTIQSDVQALDVETNNLIATDLYSDTITSPTITSSNITTSTISCTRTNIGNTTITSSGSTLQLPANTTIGGVPVSGAPIQYLYWVGAPSASGSNVFSGWILNGYNVVTATASRPFSLPVNGTLRSLWIYLTITSGITFPITNFTVSVYANDILVGSATLTTISENGSAGFGNDSLNFSVSRGQLISLRYTVGSGIIGNVNSARASVGWIPS
jgi:hypothetical protein